MEAHNPVSQLFDCFGGLRPTMMAIGEEHPNLLQNWQKAGRIPHYRRTQIVDGARANNVTLPDDLLGRVFPERKASEAAPTAQPEAA